MLHHWHIAKALLLATCLAGARPAAAQEPLDPTAAIEHHRLQSAVHKPLPEQYIWTQGDSAAASKISYDWAKQDFKADPHYFRHTFRVASAPKSATLYIAGPRSARVFLNGKLVDSVKSDLGAPIGMHVFATDVAGKLLRGSNTLALEVVRGRGIVGATNSAKTAQQTFGEVLVVKIVPAARGIEGPPLEISGPEWKSILRAPAGWEQPAFDDRAWPPVQSLGGIEDDIAFFQWSGDAGLYDWPGYDGISPFLARYSLPATAVTHVFEGRSSFANLPALTAREPVAAKAQEFGVNLAASIVEEQEAPSLMLDFGREVVGRVEFLSDSDAPAQVVIQYGESELEAASNGQYLGVNLLYIPAHGEARGPKTAFRYAKLRFVSGPAPVRFRAIRLDGIYYPVKYQGSFESSDPLLNRIWTVGAYTAHLCMQDGVWDAAKRDRGWWAGDLDVAGPTIASAFGESKLLNETFAKLIPPAGEHVNGIPSYSALWISALADLYRRTANPELLASRHDAVLTILARMDEEFDAQGRFVNKGHHWLFVDWSKDLFAFTPEAEEGTEFAMVRGYREGAWLLSQMGDAEHAAHYTARADELATGLRKQFADAHGSYGERWQMNALAVLAGVAEPKDYAAIWQDSLSSANRAATQTISPYFNAYVLDAMARMDRRADAVEWLRTYWGSMLDEGATSLWEAYDLHWPRQNPHKYLEADGRVGYFVSLAHAWSSGPTAWMMDELLGVHALTPGYARATIRPDLAGLAWIEGAVPTPHGAIRVSMHAAAKIEVELPAGIAAEVVAPLLQAGARVTVNGKTVPARRAEDGMRAVVALKGPGRFVIESK